MSVPKFNIGDFCVYNGSVKKVTRRVIHEDSTRNLVDYGLTERMNRVGEKELKTLKEYEIVLLRRIFELRKNYPNQYRDRLLVVFKNEYANSVNPK